MTDHMHDAAQPAREWMAKRCPFCGSPKGQYAASTGELSAAFICKGCGINETASQPSPAATVEIHGDGYCGCTERCRDRDNCQYDVKPVPRLSAGNADEVAKIIDPDCARALVTEREWCERYGKDFQKFAAGYITRWDVAVAKANAILALNEPHAPPASSADSASLLAEADGVLSVSNAMDMSISGAWAFIKKARDFLASAEPQAAPKLSDFAELKLLIDEYDPGNSDWNFRRGVLLDILVRIWPTSSKLSRPKHS